MRTLLAVVVASLGVTGCMSEAAKQRIEDEALIEKSRYAVGARLLDPTSPVFSQVTVRNGEVCGLVRGKNTFGGYVAHPIRFTYTEAAQATLEPDTKFGGAEGRQGPSCMFDINYRECKGEDMPSIHTCMAWLRDGDAHTPGTPVVTKATATDSCLEALDAAFKKEIRPGDLSARSARASRRGDGPWQVRVEWTAAGDNFSGLQSAGTCVVNANGLTRVTALHAD